MISAFTAIETAIATGTLRVRFADGREVFYQNTRDLLAARDAINQDLTAQSASPPSRMTRVIYSKDQPTFGGGYCR